MDEWITSHEAAMRLGVSEKTVRNRMKEGLVQKRCTRGGMYEMLESEIDLIQLRPRGRRRSVPGQEKPPAPSYPVVEFIPLDPEFAVRERAVSMWSALRHAFHEWRNARLSGKLKTAIYWNIPTRRLTDMKGIPTTMLRAILELAWNPKIESFPGIPLFAGAVFVREGGMVVVMKCGAVGQIPADYEPVYLDTPGPGGADWGIRIQKKPLDTINQ